MKKWELRILLNYDHWVCCFPILCLMRLKYAYSTSLAYQFGGLRESRFCSCLSCSLNYCFFHGTFLLERMTDKLWLFRFEYVFGCHILSESVSCSVMSDSWWLHGLWLASLLCPWNSLGKNTGVDSHSLFQGIFPSQESNLCIPHSRQILYHLSHQGRF